LLQSLHKSREAGLCVRIVRGHANKHSDAPHSVTLLRARRERPRRRAA
jgi:hypothetical protein